MIACCGAAAIQSGCAAHDDEARTVEPLAADWIHPACTAGALQPPTGVSDACNGPWSFDYVESWTNRDACGEDTSQACETYNTCTSWDRDVPGDGLGVSQTGWTEDPGGFSYGCSRTRCFQPTPTSQCLTVAANRLTALRAIVAPGVPAAALDTLGVTGAPVTVSVDGPDPETGATTTWFSCHLTITDFPVQVTAAKPVCGCAHYPAKTCTRLTGTTVTPPGQTRPADPGSPTFAGDMRAFSSGPVCLTCDQLASDTDAGAQAKFDCLDHNLAAAIGDLHASLAARMKLLLQLAGERLTPAQRARAEQLYGQDPDDGTSCSVPLVWDSACRTEAAPLGLPAQLQLCADLVANAGTSAGAASAELQHCLDELAAVGQLPADTCRLATRDAADGAAQGVLGKAYPPLTGDLTAQLPAVLTRISAWWTAATSAAGGDRTWLLGHSNMALRQLWTAIEQARVPLPSGNLTTDAAAEAVLADVTDTGFADDFGVLAALYAPGQPAPPPLLTLTGDALQPIADRLARLEALHDVGCRFAGCRTIVSPTSITLRSSETTELVHALAVLPDHDALAAALAAAGHLSAQDPAIYAALTRIRDQHGYLDTAWAALGRSEPFAQLASVTDPPAEAAALACIVRTAAVAWASYQGSGEFAPWHLPRLGTAMLQQPALVSFVDSLIAQVASARGSFATSRLATVNDLLTESRQQGTIQSTADRMAVLRDQDSDLMSQALGLESREAGERARLAGDRAAFEALVASGVLDANAAYQTHTLAPMTASAASAHYPGGASDLARDRFAVVALRTGEALRLRVGGTWAPTCAVLGAHIQGPDSDFVPIEAPDAETGPEGYWVNLANGSFHAHSSSSSNDYREDVGVETKACLGGSFLDKLGSWEACVHANVDWIHANDNTTSNGSDDRSSASFATGIRLPGTPFPEAPAGSLVAVITPTGHPEQVIDAHVVLRDDVIAAPALPAGEGDQVDVSLVVNDLGTCSAPSSSALQIEGIATTPVGNVAQAIGAAMASTLAAALAQAPAILAQGQLTIDEATALRSDAWSRVQQGLAPLGIGLAGLPYDLHQLFDGFVEGEIASIARRGQMHAISRQRLQLQLTANGLANELAFADAQDRLLLLVPRWRLRDLSGVSLAQASDALSEALTSDVAQVFELRDPAAFTQFRGQVTADTDQLIDLGVTAPYETSVQTFEDFATAARNALGGAAFDLTAQSRRTVVLAIPRTPTLCGGAPCAYGPWRSASSTLSRAFWNAMQGAPFQSTLTITPSDLYASAGTGQFSCGDVAPVIRRIAMYLDTADSAIDLSALLTEVRGTAAMAGSPALFPRVGDAVSLDADGAGGVPLAVPVLNGDVLSVVSRFGPSPDTLGIGAGLSPFTAWRFDMTPFQGGTPKAAMDAAGAVLLVFEVERRVSASNVDVPVVCQPVP